MSFKIDDDYVDVAERIRVFYEQYPEGRLTTVDWDIKPDLDGKSFVWVHAKAYRTPDDPLPGDGIAWEPIPGPTPFTKDSELMNAQTAAWGRAIIALGFATKKIASRDEVLARNGSAGGDGASDRGKPSPAADDPHGLQASRADAVQQNGSTAAADRIIHWGRDKGKRLGDLTPSQIEYYAQKWEPNPQYANDADRALKEAAIALHLGTEGVAAAVTDTESIPF